MKKHDYNFTGTIYKTVGFGKVSRTYDVEFRETKHHYITKDGTKFNKKSLNSLGGYKFKGVFLGEQIENIKKIEISDENDSQIIKALKEANLFEYYATKDVDKNEDEISIFLMDSVVLKDDVNYILNNRDEYDFDDDLEFIEKIEKLNSILCELTKKGLL